MLAYFLNAFVEELKSQTTQLMVKFNSGDQLNWFLGDKSDSIQGKIQPRI